MSSVPTWDFVKAIAFDSFAPYFVMEFIPGTSLRTLIQRGPMEPKHAAAALRQVLAALHCAKQPRHDPPGYQA